MEDDDGLWWLCSCCGQQLFLGQGQWGVGREVFCDPCFSSHVKDEDDPGYQAQLAELSPEERGRVITATRRLRCNVMPSRQYMKVRQPGSTAYMMEFWQ